jgi:hypothetical protein
LIIYVAALIASVCTLLIEGVEFWRSVRLAAPAAAVLQLTALAVIYFAWKWIPGFSLFIFPNLSGRWTGKIEYRHNEKNVELPASLDVAQNLNEISLVLETEGAESETLVVYPRRLSNRRVELLYVYETHSKEGKPPPSYRYRGTAVIRVEDRPSRMVGNYYTEQGGRGTVSFSKARK